MNNFDNLSTEKTVIANIALQSLCNYFEKYLEILDFIIKLDEKVLLLLFYVILSIISLYFLHTYR